MAKTAKTIDAAIVVGRSTWLQSLTKVLEATITGTVGVTQEPTIGATDEDATVHTVGASIELGTLYDGDETDALRGHVFDDDDPYCAIIDATSDLNSFELYPVSLSELANTVPAADAITDGITMPQSGLGAYGSGAVAVTPFAFAAGAVGAVSIGTIPAGAARYLVVTVNSKTGNLVLTVGGVDITVAGAGSTHSTPWLGRPPPRPSCPRRPATSAARSRPAGTCSSAKRRRCPVASRYRYSRQRPLWSQPPQAHPPYAAWWTRLHPSDA